METNQLALAGKQPMMDPMQMIQLAFQKAIDSGEGLQVVDRILEQQKWMILHGEEEAFNASLKRIQKKMKSIPKRGWTPDTKSKFATTEDIDAEIQSLLDEENMALSFVPAVSEKPDMVLIIGTLALGAFEKRYPLEMPADGKGAKGGGVMSRTHATGAAITYAKRYLKNMIFDLRFGETDDDGNGSAGLSDAIKISVNAISDCDTLESLKEKYRKEYKAAVDANDSTAVKAFMDAYNARKKELGA